MLLLALAVAALAALAAPLVLPADDAAALDTARLVFEQVTKGQWWPALGPIVVLAVFALKKWDYLIPKVGPAIDKFMDQPVVSFLLPFGLSAVGGFGTAIAAGQRPVEAVGTMFKVAMEAIVLYVGAKKVQEQAAAGLMAANAVAAGGKPAAIEELKKP